MSKDKTPNPDPADPRLMTGEAWNSFCDSLKQAGRLVLDEEVPNTPRHRAEGFRYLARSLASGVLTCITHDDPDYPVFGRMMDHTRPWGLDFPDCLYLYAPVRGGASYKIWGRRGSAHHFDLQLNCGHCGDGDMSGWRCAASISGFELETDANGEFELWIGGDPRPKNWLPSAPDVQFILIRQIFNDWEAESPGDFFIERVGAQWPIPPPRTDWMADHIEKLGNWFDSGCTLWESMSRGVLSGEPNNLVVVLAEMAEEHTGTRGQAYGMGGFECDLHEAVIIEFRPPSCHHWSVSLANYYWENIEFGSRQSSLNGAQATLDEDGVFRAVIAHQDPLVPNWLDPAENTCGTLVVRFILAEAAPDVRIKRLPWSDLRTALPESTPEINPATRQQILHRRRHAVLRRYRH